MYKGTLLYPRIGLGVYDLPQERAELCLKDHNSFRDCTYCLMPTKLKQQPDDELRYTSQKRARNSMSRQKKGECQILQRQLDAAPSEARDVYETVKFHLLLAKRKLIHNGSDPVRNELHSGALKKAREYLQDVSARELPPAFAAFCGMGSYPFRLYSCIGFDKLHVVEHGILRAIPDDAFKVFEASGQYNGWSKGEVVKIANQRILDAPRSAQITAFQPFRKNANEKQAGVTGKLRRDTAPFLWYSLMGIPSSTKPDDDPLVQLLLKADFMQQQLLGINREPTFGFRTNEDIEKLSKLCFEVGKLMTETLGSFVTTKAHRIMRHISDHFLDHGCIRRGSTDDNETMHKVTRKAYRSTNKHLQTIAPQLLSARIEIESNRAEDMSALQSFDKSDHLALLITRNPLVKDKAGNTSESVVSGNESNEQRTGDDEMLASLMPNAFENDQSPHDAEKAISKFLHPSSNINIWIPVKSMRFMAKLPWWPDHKVWQVAYAGDNVFRTENRRDAILYRKNADTFYGILQAIFRHRSDRRSHVALVRRLKSVEPEEGNKHVVEKYRNKRFAYCIRGQNVTLDTVPCSKVVRQVMLVPDPYVVSRLYGAKRRMNDLPDTTNSRKTMRFFELSGFKYSSLAEWHDVP